MRAHREWSRSCRGAGLILALATSACAAPPGPSPTEARSGRFDVALAHMYLDGSGVPRDDTKAAYLLSNASALGNVDATEMLGQLYADGRGVHRDDDLATSLFRAAVDGGNVAALTDLGRMLETGRGNGRDPNAALRYYERGMAAGDQNARDNYKRLKKSLDAAPTPSAAPPSNPQITAKALTPPT
ncbi:hypothetical protein GCM10011611_46870 [Aliidongia dinghuensis]|uniref:Sel1 repeat family protein n=1 Tax=Aliidongia dinghuensis TaxID=1867774 RepID=A0A8J2YZ96_9PROT|nr:tetratricopeptide repeat protein [Aliidongia dinghuensis]GGF35215.1 hypothetical protein GCM10011611_46870 [Aliidongia dinghuensis]